MTRYAFFTHILFFLGLLLLSLAVCGQMIKKLRIMDIPNERSSHDRPVPKSGGIVIVITFVIGVMAIYFFGDVTLIKKRYFFTFFISSLVIAGISLFDDIREVPFNIRLLSQAGCAVSVMAMGIVIHQLSFPWAGRVNLGIAGYVITFLWIIGLTNAYNFMDGLNGMAAGPCAIAAFFFCVISFNSGSTFVYIISYTLIAGALGFLFYNFPRPSLFMGDVGSAFIGFTFANLAIIAALYDHSHTSFFVMPLLLFNFIFDTSFTFIRRLLRGENVFYAHRTHLYQLFNQLGYSHVKVSVFHFIVCIAQGLGALYMVNIVGSRRALTFVPYIIFQVFYARAIVKRAKEKGIIISN